jgi:predicted peroxiredoxin
MPRPTLAHSLLALLILLMAGAAIAQDDDQDDQPSLFVNLTSDEMNRAAMAISFSTRVRTEKQIPVTIFLNVEGARLADTGLPPHRHVSGQTLQEMLTDFMAAGGQVIVCPMCLKNVAGITAAAVLEGIAVGSSEVTWPPLFADDVTVLSY